MCGGTGAWSKPWSDAGYDVHVITLPDFDITKTSITKTSALFISQDARVKNLYVAFSEIHGILCAPPCTMFSRARTTAKTPRDFDGAMEVVRACLDIIWRTRSHHHSQLSFWALENPMGLLRQFLGNPSHSFRGWEYGDRHVKFTDLWGYFKMPTPLSKSKSKQPIFNRARWASPKKPKEYAHLKLSRADIRAITPSGFAQAFFKANV